MIRKLKIKFIIIIVSLVGIIMLGVVVTIGHNSYQHARAEVTRALEMAIDESVKQYPDAGVTGMLPGRGMEAMPPEPLATKPLNYSAIVVEVSSDGKSMRQINDQYVFIEEDVLSDAVEEAMQKENESGRLGGQNLFFLKNSIRGMEIIAFADTAYFDETIKTNLLNLLVLFLLGIVLLLFVSVFLAELAVKPVRKTWEQQRRFVADASHELKTPLTVILANSEVLLSDSCDCEEDRNKWIKNTQKEAEHMKELIDDLLLLAKSDEEATETRAIMEQVNLSDLITGIALQFEAVAFDAGASLEMKIEEDVQMNCNSLSIKQLVHILLDNAVKYTDMGGCVSISLRKHGSKKVICVHNSGEAIATQDIEYIFDRFYRADKARTGRNGYGLGLAIAKSIVENHGGKITVESDAINGTSMTVVF